MLIIDLFLFTVHSWVDWIHQAEGMLVMLLTLEEVVL